MAIDNWTGEPKDISTGVGLAFFFVMLLSISVTSYLMGFEIPWFPVVLINALGSFVIKLDRRIDYLEKCINQLKRDGKPHE